MKIKELYQTRFPKNPFTSSNLLPGTPSMPPSSPGCHPPPSYEQNPGGATQTLPTPLDLMPGKGEGGALQLCPSAHPDVTMKRLPFYDVYDELIKPTTLASIKCQRLGEAHFTFALTPQQVQQILTSRDLLPGSKCDYTIQVQLRFCLCETSCPQEDSFPPNLFVKVNGKLCPLPAFLPPSRNEAELKRPSHPVNITPLARLSATVPNTIVVNWATEFGGSYSLSVYLVKQLTSGMLLQQLRSKGIRNPDHSRALIKEKLTADPDSEVATTSLRVSLMCPLGKRRLVVPCRASSCSHLQSFDAALYLQMNEKKPTWTCPVCDQKAPYDTLIIDGLFLEILNSCRDCDEIQFMEDGSWCPLVPKEKQDPCQGTTLPGTEGNVQGAEGRRKVEVIDLTLESSSDEEEPPGKKLCPGTSLAPPATAKGLVGTEQPSVLRSPPLARPELSTANLVPKFQPPCQGPSELQGLDLFSFLPSENQLSSPSVITSLDGHNPLGHFFQSRGHSKPFLGTTPRGARGSLGTMVSSGHRGADGSRGLPGCSPDVISLD